MVSCDYTSKTTEIPMAIKIYRTDERKKGNRLSLIFIRKISQCLVFGVFGAAQRNTSFHLGKSCFV